jgi:hypothetical protein
MFLRQNKPDFEFVVPEEGGLLWSRRSRYPSARTTRSSRICTYKVRDAEEEQAWNDLFGEVVVG